jgi:hypothetical protein
MEKSEVFEILYGTCLSQKEFADLGIAANRFPTSSYHWLSVVGLRPSFVILLSASLALSRGNESLSQSQPASDQQKCQFEMLSLKK